MGKSIKYFINKNILPQKYKMTIENKVYLG